jgi:ubiquinone/menaquinone biosynthesis C-methylase UbiE
MKPEVVKKNLQQIEEGYNLIAKKFSETRKHFWRNLEFTKQYVKEGDKILDFGCGNGRLLELFAGKKIVYKGVDISQNLLELAKKKYPENKKDFIRISSDELSLPFSDKNFNSVYSVATFHHLPGKTYRKRVVRELYRVMKPEGWIIITVWNLWQKKYRRHLYKNWLKKLGGRSKMDWNDCRINFTDNTGKVFARYHHAFTKKELMGLFREAGFNIIEVKTVGGNIVLVGQKPKL